MAEFVAKLAGGEGRTVRVWKPAKWNDDNMVNQIVVVAVLKLR